MKSSAPLSQMMFQSLVVLSVLLTTVECFGEPILASESAQGIQAKNTEETKPAKDDQESVLSRAQGAWRLGRFDRAIAELDRAIEEAPDDARLFVARARCWIGKKYPRSAVEDANTAIRLNPNLPDAYDTRAMAWIDLKEWMSAIAECSEEIERRPNRAEPYHARGYCQLQLGRSEEAIQDFRKALEHDPKGATARVPLAFLLAVSTDLPLRDGALAAKLMEEDLKSAPGRDELRLSILAAAYAESGDFQKAVETQRTAVALGVRPLEGRCVMFFYMMKIRPNAHFLGGIWKFVIGFIASILGLMWNVTKIVRRFAGNNY